MLRKSTTSRERLVLQIILYLIELYLIENRRLFDTKKCLGVFLNALKTLAEILRIPIFIRAFERTRYNFKAKNS